MRLDSPPYGKAVGRVTTSGRPCAKTAITITMDSGWSQKAWTNRNGVVVVFLPPGTASFTVKGATVSGVITRENATFFELDIDAATGKVSHFDALPQEFLDD